MFHLGFWETIIILVVALVFIGPNKLPEVARTMGRAVRSLRRAMSGLEEEVRQAYERAFVTESASSNWMGWHRMGGALGLRTGDGTLLPQETWEKWQKEHPARYR